MSRVGDYLREKVEAYALEEVSSRSLGLIRIALCFNILNEYVSYLAIHHNDTRPVVIALIWVLFVANFFVMFGYKTRWTVIVWWASFAILHLYFGRYLYEVVRMKQPVQAFQCITVLTISGGCGRSLSIDRALEVRRARAEGREPAPERVAAWTYDLIALVIASIYFWAALDKTDAAWFRGERMEHYYMSWYGGSDSLVYTPWVHWGAVFFAWATTILEFALAFGLVFRKSRPWVVIGGFMLHIGIALTLAVTYFSFKMMAALFACVPPNWVHRVVGGMLGDPREPAPP